MDWLWPLYQEHLQRVLRPEVYEDQSSLRDAFMSALSESTATLYVMEPCGDTIVFKGLGQWPLSSVPNLMIDPNAFIADNFGGGKFKVNFHQGLTFVGTHNFRAYGDEKWRDMEEVEVG